VLCEALSRIHAGRHVDHIKMLYGQVVLYPFANHEIRVLSEDAKAASYTRNVLHYFIVSLFHCLNQLKRIL